MRALAALALAVCCTAFAQLPRSQAPVPEEKPEGSSAMDAIVTDDSGRPVTGLSAGDFEVTQKDSPRKVSGVSYVDGAKGRTFVFVIDDLELPPEALAAARAAIRTFLDSEFRASDRAAIVTTAEGGGTREELSSNTDFLLASLNRIQPVVTAAPHLNPREAARAAFCRLRLVVENLEKVPGRKFVAWVSNRSVSDGAGLDGSYFETLRYFAARSSVSFYCVEPEPPDSQSLNTGLCDLAQRSGGLVLGIADLARMARDAGGYYRVSFTLEDPDYRLLNRFESVRVRVKRPGAIVRSSPSSLDESEADPWQADISLADDTMFTGSALDIQGTPLYQNLTQGSSVLALIHVDLRGVTMTEDLKGLRTGRLQLAVATLDMRSYPLDQSLSSVKLTFTDAEYRAALRNGLFLSERLPLRRTPAGGCQFLLLVRDEASSNLGTASRYLEIPDVGGGSFSVSAVTLEKSSPAGSAATDTATLRNFHAGELLRYSYLLYNAAVDTEKRSRVTVTLRLYRSGQAVFQSHSLPLEFPAAAGTRRRSASGTVRLGENLPPGMYHFQIVVNDTLAPAGKPSMADSFTDFEIKP
jgi:VWFA-related protein